MDVQSEIDEGPDQVAVGEAVDGIVAETYYARGYGFIRCSDGRKAFFHVSYLPDNAQYPPIGTSVTCQLADTPKGLQAYDISLVDQHTDFHSTIPSSSGLNPRDFPDEEDTYPLVFQKWPS